MSETLHLIAQKAALRAEMRQRLRAITEEDRQARSERIRDGVLQFKTWCWAKSIVLFSPLPTEPQIASLAQIAAADAKVVAVIPSAIRVATQIKLPDKLDLIFIPGLAFSKDRHRLGRGGGFFDRLLAGRAARAFKLGICFPFKGSRRSQPKLTTF